MVSSAPLAAYGQVQVLSSTKLPTEIQEERANTVAIPGQILKTGVNISVSHLAPNTLQLAENLKLIPLLQRIKDLRRDLKEKPTGISLENLALRQDLTESMIQARQKIDEANLAIDFTIAEIVAEENVYSEVLATTGSERDRAVNRTNSSSFIANGILWAVAEGLDIPTYRYPKYSIPSGINGVLAGILPSMASLYAMRQYSGRKRTSEDDPNMLAKLFDYPTNPEIEYPNCVWQFLNTVPADDHSGRTRRDQLIDRWIADKNISGFTNRKSKRQLDVITASSPHHKALSLDSLTIRQVMLQQLSAEILKMKRLLYELTLAISGDKQI
jgi:hypothetical protein